MTLVHAVPLAMPPPPPSILMVGDDDWQQIGDTILADVAAELRSLSRDRVPVDTHSAHGHPGTILSQMAAADDLVVLQHQDASRLHRIFTGSTVASAAAQSRCPVVSVPASFLGPPEHQVVSVGLHEDGGPSEALEAAFSEAAGIGATVRLVHALRLAPAYDDLLLVDEQWERETRAVLTAAAARMSERHPQVSVTIDVHHEWPADALVAQSRRSDLLVLGRHGRRGPIPPRLGSTARSVVAHADCPVMVVPVS